MFGNLFEEEEDEGLSLNNPKRRNAKQENEPPPPRGRSNLCGIKNQGGTCYLNSLLQTLLFTPEFRGTIPANKRQLSLRSVHNLSISYAEELFRLGPDELGCLEDKDKPEAKVSP